ncbi:hypothetical protein HanLR1_Chr13g0482571 [Helianthus annuus]|nr:hypothetical protein HanLR1_Chr13g0482571 [Helianthus annuus]
MKLKNRHCYSSICMLNALWIGSSCNILKHRNAPSSFTNFQFWIRNFRKLHFGTKL